MTHQHVTWHGNCAVTHWNLNLVALKCQTWLVHVWHDSFLCDTTPLYLTWLIHVGHDSFICDMTHPYVIWSDVTRQLRSPTLKAFPPVVLQCQMWLVHMWYYSFLWDMTHSYVTWLGNCAVTHWNLLVVTLQWQPWLVHWWHDSFMCDVTHSYVIWLVGVWYDSFLWEVTHSYVTWLDSCAVTHWNLLPVALLWQPGLVHIWHDTFTCDITHKYITWLIHMWCNSGIARWHTKFVKHWNSWHIHIIREVRDAYAVYV